MNEAIVIPSHRTGVKFLKNLLNSFRGYNKYPILIVINEFKKSDLRLFTDIIRSKKYDNMLINLEKIETNAFEFGGLYTAYNNTNYEEFFLLPHSCEIIDNEIFDIVFEKYRNKSLAFAVQTYNWDTCWSNLGEKEKDLILTYLDAKTNQELLRLGNFKFWQGHTGKYRRKILDMMDLDHYLPNNMIEAMSKSELLFTSSYHSLDRNTVALFSGWVDGNKFEYKFGKLRMKIGNEYIIKWKTHWNIRMVIMDVRKSKDIKLFLKSQCYETISAIIYFVKHKAPFIYSLCAKIKSHLISKKYSCK